MSKVFVLLLSPKKSKILPCIFPLKDAAIILLKQSAIQIATMISGWIRVGYVQYVLLTKYIYILLLF